MTNSHFISHPSHKWQQMRAIVNRNPCTTQGNLALSFKKLVISRLFTENALVFLLQYIGLTLSTLLPYPAPLWMASGTACAFIFLRGYTVLGGIWLGSFAAYYLASDYLLLSFSCATLFALQACLLFFVCQRYIGPTLLFSSREAFLRFLFFSGLLTALIALSLLGVCYTALPHAIPALPLWTTWWLANWNGVLLLSLALTTLDAYFPQILTLKKLNKIKLVIAYGCLMLFVFLLLLDLQPFINLGLFSLIFVCIFLIARSYGWCGLFAALSLSGFELSLGAYLEAPFFMQAEWFILLCLQLTLVLSLGINAVLRYPASAASKYSMIN